MERTRFNPARLTLARRRRALTKVELAERVSLTARRIAAFENQGEVPPQSTLQEIAKVLDFPENFFYRPVRSGPSVDAVSFRSFSRLPAGRRDAALAASTLAIELADYIDQRFDLPVVDIPDLREVDPSTAALAVRSAWALGEKPLPNAIHLLEAHGVRVYSLVDDCAALDGFSFWQDGIPAVFLTYHKSPERGRWDAAHELGHLVLHQGARPQSRELEQEADAFAAELLLPASGVCSTAPRFVSLPEVGEEKRYWRVSAVAYIRRLHHLGRLTERQYKSLIIEASQAGYRRAEGDIDQEVSQLVPKILGLLREDGVTIADMANILEVTTRELRGLLFSSLNVVDGDGPVGPSGNRRHLRVV